jgi:hypothetical protein
MESNVMTLIRETEVAPKEASGQITCCHHWAIEAPNGQFSRGVCLNCHEEKLFRNSLRDSNPVRQYGMRRFYRPSVKSTVPQSARKPIA